MRWFWTTAAVRPYKENRGSGTQSMRDAAGVAPRRQEGKEIFACIAGVVGASRFEFFGGAVAVGNSNGSYTVRTGCLDIEVTVADHKRGGWIERMIFHEATEQRGLAVISGFRSVRIHSKEVGAQSEFFQHAL